MNNQVHHNTASREANCTFTIFLQLGIPVKSANSAHGIPVASEILGICQLELQRSLLTKWRKVKRRAKFQLDPLCNCPRMNDCLVFWHTIETQMDAEDIVILANHDVDHCFFPFIPIFSWRWLDFKIIRNGNLAICEEKRQTFSFCQ